MLCLLPSASLSSTSQQSPLTPTTGRLVLNSSELRPAAHDSPRAAAPTAGCSLAQPEARHSTLRCNTKPAPSGLLPLLPAKTASPWGGHTGVAAAAAPAARGPASQKGSATAASAGSCQCLLPMRSAHPQEGAAPPDGALLLPAGDGSSPLLLLQVHVRCAWSPWSRQQPCRAVQCLLAHVPQGLQASKHAKNGGIAR